MHKIAFRNFWLLGLSVLICIVLFTALLLAQLYQYTVDDQFESLTDDASNISSLAYVWEVAPYKMDTTALLNALVSQAKRDNTHIMIVDGSGTVQLYANANNNGLLGGEIAPEIMEKVRSGAVHREVGNLGGYFGHALISVVLPVRDAAGNFRVAVAVSTTRDAIFTVFALFLRGVLMITVFVVMFGTALLYYITQKTTRPLKEMSAASKRIARGDYTVRVNTSGADEISDLAVSFNHMAESMEKLEKLRSEFIANVSHELKTPMTSIGGFVDGILDGTIPAEQTSHYLGIVSEETHRLSRMVTKLLLATRLQAGMQDLNIVTLDICGLIGGAVINAEQAADERGIQVEIDLPQERVFVRGDGDALKQVVTNLFDNAVKYGNTGGTVRVSLERQGDKVLVHVFNTGTGVEQEHLPYVFDRFYKVDRSRGMDKDSTGLGLYITKSILKNLGQEIWAESEYGAWIRFTFTLDAADPPENCRN